jgi:hypothetical protein
LCGLFSEQFPIGILYRRQSFRKWAQDQIMTAEVIR